MITSFDQNSVSDFSWPVSSVNYIWIWCKEVPLLSVKLLSMSYKGHIFRDVCDVTQFGDNSHRNIKGTPTTISIKPNGRRRVALWFRILLYCVAMGLAWNLVRTYARLYIACIIKHPCVEKIFLFFETIKTEPK